MTDYYQYMNLSDTSKSFRFDFNQLVTELMKEYGIKKINHRTLSFSEDGSYGEPEITFEVCDLDFDTRHKIDEKIKELLNKHHINFSFGTAG